MMRSSALSLALGYVALGIAALVLFAAPLWYAWQVTIQDGRSEILQADAQRLTDVYRRDGARCAQEIHRHTCAHADRRRAHPAAHRPDRSSRSPAICPPGRAICPRLPATTASRSTWARRAFSSPWCMSRCSATSICWSAATTSCSRRWSGGFGTAWPPPSRCSRSRVCWSASSPGAPSCRASTASVAPSRPSFTAT